jgi:prophage maintenance system killer protein
MTACPPSFTWTCSTRTYCWPPFRRRRRTSTWVAIWQKAGAIAQSVAGNHGFTDGNKRTALLLVLLLLDRSGYWLQPINGEDPQTVVTDLMVRVAEHQIEIDAITEWFRLRIVRVKKS